MKKRFLSIILAILIVATQFSLISVFPASAETAYTALTGREDFVFGVNIRANNGYGIYHNTYSTIVEAKSLGSSIVRIKNQGLANGYIKGLAGMAEQKDIDIMLTDTAIHQYVNGVAVADINIDAIKSYYTNLATALKGSVEYYQIGNEMDISARKSGQSGLDVSHYNNLDTYAVGIYAAVNAIKAVDKDAKVVVNTSWLDAAFIEGIKAVEIDTVTGTVAESGTTNETTNAAWDLMGIDWYSNGANKDFTDAEGKPLDYVYVIDKLSQWSEDVIICESNLWSTGYNADGTVDYVEDAAWLAEFVQYAYSVEKVKGFIAYELYDVASLENENKFEKEAHFGLIDTNGVRKDTYSVLQALYGGSDIVRTESISAAPQDEMAGTVINAVYSDIYSFNIENTYDGYGTADDPSNMFFDISTNPIETNSSTTPDSFVLEFDMYVEDAEAFVSAGEAAGVTLAAGLYGDEKTYRRVAKQISLSNIEKDGWNHIVLSGRHFDDVDGGTSMWGHEIDEISIGYLTTNATPIYNPISGMNVAISNVCVTQISDTSENNAGGAIKYTFTGKHKQNRLGVKNNSGKYIYGGLPTNAVIGTTSVHLGYGKYIELDLYIDNYTNFKKSLTEDASGNTVNYGLMLGTSSGGTNVTTAANSRLYDITKMISHSGWNHIMVPIGDPDANNQCSGGNILSCTLYYYNYSSKGAITSKNTTVLNPAGNDFFALKAPVTTSRAVPEKKISDDKLLVSDIAVDKEVALKAVLAYSNDDFNITGLNFTLNSAEYFEFDFFIDTDDILRNLLAEHNAERLLLRLYNEENGFVQYNVYSQIKKAGWNHMIVPLENLYVQGFDIANDTVVRIQFYFDNTPDTANATNIGALKKAPTMRVANAVTTVDFPVPDKLVSDYTSIGEDEKLQFEVSSGAFLLELSEAVDISSEKMIELDIYVEDVDAVEGQTVLALADDGDWVASIDISSQIIADGWNHIQFNLAALEGADTFNFTAITQWYISNESTDFAGYIINFYAANYVTGDIDRDGLVNVLDYIGLAKATTGIVNANTNKCAVDSDNNFELDSKDLIVLKKQLLGIPL